jgi:hypothetical protein
VAGGTCSCALQALRTYLQHAVHETCVAQVVEAAQPQREAICRRSCCGSLQAGRQAARLRQHRRARRPPAVVCISSTLESSMQGSIVCAPSSCMPLMQQVQQAATAAAAFSSPVRWERIGRHSLLLLVFPQGASARAAPAPVASVAWPGWPLRGRLQRAHVSCQLWHIQLPVPTATKAMHQRPALLYVACELLQVFSVRAMCSRCRWDVEP